MSFEEMLVALVAVVAGMAFMGYVSAKIFELIKTWINRKEGGVPNEEFQRLAKAFMQYKKDTERRLRHLEAIVSEEDSSSTNEQSKSPKQVEAPKEGIEIEDKQEQSRTKGSDNLRNMLRE